MCTELEPACHLLAQKNGTVPCASCKSMVKRGIFCIMARWAPHSDVGANMAMTRCQVNVNIDEFGWVNVNDLLSSEPWLDRNDEI